MLLIAIKPAKKPNCSLEKQISNVIQHVIKDICRCVRGRGGKDHRELQQSFVWNKEIYEQAMVLAKNPGLSPS